MGRQQTKLFARPEREAAIVHRSPLDDLTDAELLLLQGAERQGLAYIVYTDGEGHHHVRSLDRQRLVLGRSEGADLMLPWDRAVSRRHAAFEYSDEGWWLVDESLNGTLVNGERVRERCLLHDRDLVQVGESALAYCIPAAYRQAALS